jgi:hypothetical protein
MTEEPEQVLVQERIAAALCVSCDFGMYTVRSTA